MTAGAHPSLRGAFPRAPVADALTGRNDLSQTSTYQPVPEGAAETMILPCGSVAGRDGARCGRSLGHPGSEPIPPRRADATGIFRDIISSSFKSGVFSLVVSESPRDLHK